MPNPQAKLVLPLQAVLNLTDAFIERLENHQQHLDEDMGVTRPPPAQQAALNNRHWESTNSWQF